MYKGINLAETEKYVDPQDPDKANPTVFHLGTLDSFVKAAIEDATTEFEDTLFASKEGTNIKINFAKRNLLVAKFGVRKIENYADPKTGEVTGYSAELTSINGRPYLAISDDVLSAFPDLMLVTRLAQRILTINSLSEGEAKN